ncbi:MAG TPA: cation transport regulator ChaB, partial [Marinobacter hydrocarbonoclasticus]|nr:cation transport regulator ChaB [Marinobacter nauticus]
MPYDRKSDLPDGVRNNLPAHAQEIYRKAFNSAWEEYRNPED